MSKSINIFNEKLIEIITSVNYLPRNSSYANPYKKLREVKHEYAKLFDDEKNVFNYLEAFFLVNQRQRNQTESLSADMIDNYKQAGILLHRHCRNFDIPELCLSYYGSSYSQVKLPTFTSQQVANLFIHTDLEIAKSLANVNYPTANFGLGGVGDIDEVDLHAIETTRPEIFQLLQQNSEAKDQLIEYLDSLKDKNSVDLQKCFTCLSGETHLTQTQINALNTNIFCQTADNRIGILSNPIWHPLLTKQVLEQCQEKFFKYIQAEGNIEDTEEWKKYIFKLISNLPQILENLRETEHIQCFIEWLGKIYGDLCHVTHFHHWGKLNTIPEGTSDETLFLVADTLFKIIKKIPRSSINLVNITASAILSKASSVILMVDLAKLYMSKFIEKCDTHEDRSYHFLLLHMLSSYSSNNSLLPDNLKKSEGAVYLSLAFMHAAIPESLAACHRLVSQSKMTDEQGKGYLQRIALLQPKEVSTKQKEIDKNPFSLKNPLSRYHYLMYEFEWKGLAVNPHSLEQQHLLQKYSKSQIATILDQIECEYYCFKHAFMKNEFNPSSKEKPTDVKPNTFDAQIGGALHAMVTLLLHLPDAKLPQATREKLSDYQTKLEQYGYSYNPTVVVKIDSKVETSSSPQVSSPRIASLIDTDILHDGGNSSTVHDSALSTSDELNQFQNMSNP